MWTNFLQEVFFLTETVKKEKVNNERILWKPITVRCLIPENLANFMSLRLFTRNHQFDNFRII